MTRLENIQFIAATRAMLGLPQFSGYRTERETLRIPIAIRPDARYGSRHMDEWVVFWDAAIVIHAVHFPIRLREILASVFSL
jgi:hypothetical protein